MRKLLSVLGGLVALLGVAFDSAPGRRLGVAEMAVSWGGSPPVVDKACYTPSICSTPHYSETTPCASQSPCGSGYFDTYPNNNDERCGAADKTSTCKESGTEVFCGMNVTCQTNQSTGACEDYLVYSYAKAMSWCQDTP